MKNDFLSGEYYPAWYELQNAICSIENHSSGAIFTITCIVQVFARLAGLQRHVSKRCQRQQAVRDGSTRTPRRPVAAVSHYITLILLHLFHYIYLTCSLQRDNSKVFSNWKTMIFG